MAVVVAEDLHRSYGRGAVEVHALRGVSLSVQRGEVVAVMGPSGCGKSTLLHVLGGLDDPDRGSVTVTGRRWQDLSSRERAGMRRRTCGFVFQSLALLPMATAAENIEVPLVLDGVAASQRTRLVGEALERVGLSGKGGHLPDQLSGGEQQRVGIARALILRPALVLADEPTGSLDSETAQAVTRTLVEAASSNDSAIVLVTHDPAVARHASRTLWLHSGMLNGQAGLVQSGPR